MAAGFSFSDLVGGVTDAIGLSNNQEKSRAYNSAEQTYNDILAESDETYSDIINKIKESGEDVTSLLGGDDTISNYLSSIESNANKDYSVDSSKLSDYEFDKSISDYLNPNADYLVDKAVNSAQNTLAGQGNLFSGGVGQLAADTSADVGAELWDEAQSAYNTDKSFDYGTVKDALNIDTSNAANEMTQDTNYTSNLGNLSSSIIDTKNTTSDNTINALLSKLGTDTDIQQALAQLGITEASDFSSIASDLTGGLL